MAGTHRAAIFSRMDEHPLILVPIDGSPLSHRALPHAVELAKRCGGRLLLLAVLDSSMRRTLASFAESESISIEDATAGMLRRAVHETLDDTGVAVDVDYVPAEDAAEAILEFAEAHDVGMIVLTSHGRSGPGRWLLGSVAHKLVQAAPVPVTVVPARES